jgi:hypothetical protein
VHVTVTNAQWHLALLACLLISAVAAKTTWEKMLDVSALILCGFTGPFCLMLLPVALLMAWKRPDSWRKIPVAIMAVTSAIQLGALLVAGRPPLPLGASAELLVEILAGHIYAAGLLGPNRLALISPAASLLAIAVLGTSLVLYCFARAAFEFKMVIFFWLWCWQLRLEVQQVRPFPHGRLFGTRRLCGTGFCQRRRSHGLCFGAQTTRDLKLLLPFLGSLS